MASYSLLQPLLTSGMGRDEHTATQPAFTPFRTNMKTRGWQGHAPLLLRCCGIRDPCREQPGCSLVQLVTDTGSMMPGFVRRKQNGMYQGFGNISFAVDHQMLRYLAFCAKGKGGFMSLQAFHLVDLLWLWCLNGSTKPTHNSDNKMCLGL